MTAILQQISLAIATIMSLISGLHTPIFGAIRNDKIIETTLIRVEEVKENLKDVQLEVKADLSLPVEKVDRQVRGKNYTASELTQLKQEMGTKVKNFKNETSTSNEELAVIFDLLNQNCAGKNMGRTLTIENTNAVIGDLVENGC